jgi:hypothetical protein
MTDKKEYPPMKLTDEFRFGKHIGTTVESVITDTPTYIKWAVDEKVIKLDNDAFALYEGCIAEWEVKNPKKS